MSAQNSQEKSQDAVLAARGRLVSVVIVGTMLVWMLSLWLAPKFGMTTRHSVLIDLLALAALAWSFIVSLQIRRARKAARDNG